LVIAFALIASFVATPNRAIAHDLRTLPTPQVLTPNICASVTPAAPFTPPAAGYTRKYNTIGHRFLDDELGAGDVTPAMYAILDTLIDEGLTVLKPIPAHLSADQAKDFAVDALKTIDCILLRHGFVYPGKGLVQLLSDGLGPTMYDDPVFRNQLRNQSHNVRREKFIDARGAGPFYVVDCDIASYIYLAIAEVMKYPLHLIEIPKHNFVRWEFGSGSFIDFETMDGFKTDDDYYKTIWGIPASFVGRGGILETMNVKQALAYHYATVAISWSWRGNIIRMKETYLQSISTDASHAFALNNLAWFYAAVPKIELRDGAKAVQYGLRAVAILADSDNLDTLACSYAQNHDFSGAINAENTAIRVGFSPFGSGLQDDLKLFQGVPPQTCNDSTFGKDQQPFRPEQDIAGVVSDKVLLRFH